MQALKEQIESTSKFLKEGLGDRCLTKDIEGLENRLDPRSAFQIPNSKSGSKRKKHKKKRSKARR